MKTVLPLIIVLLSLVTSSLGRDPIVGDWKWFTGEIIKFGADGGAVSSKGHGGKWLRETARTGEYKYTLNWKDGEFVDKVSLSKDRKTLTGSNQSGAPINAERWKK